MLATIGRGFSDVVVYKESIYSQVDAHTDTHHTHTLI
jgi:hypothetical protein